MYKIFIIYWDLIMDEKHNIEALYTPNQYYKLLAKFNQLFNLFRCKFSDEFELKYWITNGDVIMNIERWIVTDDCKIFWDYLWAAHEKVEKLKGALKGEQKCRCIKFIFSSWKTLTISTNTSPSHTPEWITCLDALFFKLNEYERKTFDSLYMDINKFEYEHFHSITHQKALFKAEASSDLLTALNATKE